jgi:hypothetical protein
MSGLEGEGNGGLRKDGPGDGGSQLVCGNELDRNEEFLASRCFRLGPVTGPATFLR